MEESLSKKISFYNFICTILIVIYHSKHIIKYFTSSKLVYVDRLYSLFDIAGYIAMGCFFAISGFLFYLGINDKASLIKKVKKRVITLAVPFVTWNTIMMIQNIFVGWYSHNLNMTLEDIILGHTFYAFTGGIWYLLALIILMVLSPLMLLLKNKHKLLFVIVLISFVGSFLINQYVHSVTLIGSWFVRLAYYVPLYLTGAYCGLCKSELAARKSKLISIVSAILSIIIITAYVMGLTTPVTTWILFHILPITFWLSLDCSLFVKLRVTYPMKVTFFVYTLHMYLIDLLKENIVNFIPPHSLRLYLAVFFYVGYIAVIYLTAMLVAYCAKRLLPKKLYFALSGGRVK